MNKKNIVLFSIIVFCIFMSTSIHAAPLSAADDFRAVWVCTVANLDWPSKPGLSVAEMKAEADKIIFRSAALGFNAIVFQARPAADSFYKSDIFPWAYELTGVQGVAPADGFDPLLYWIQKSHEAGLELHAWINPYRVARTASATLAANNPARLNPSWVVKYGNLQMFDPGLPECRDLIIRGVIEIIENYDVDGIHLDDYFYPYPESGVAFNDDYSYKTYGGGAELADWRRQNVDMLVSDLNKKIKENASIRFGISPFAIWQNSSSTAQGSETSGLESYKSIYADSRKWVTEGWVDYICPQIYWRIGFNVADYEKVLKWWVDLCKGTDVDLYVGHAAYKEVDGDAGWSGEIIRQLRMNEIFKEVKGSVFFRTSYLNGALGDAIGDYYAAKPINAPAKKQPPPPVKMTKLTVAQPSGNTTVSDASGYTVHGTANPDLDVFINEKKITNITPEGFWSVYVDLSSGVNTFTVKQDGQETVTRVITLEKNLSMPNRPPYTPPKIIEISPDERLYATVSVGSAWVYPNAASTGGSSWLLEKGQKDLIIAKTSDDTWFKLSCGAWIEADNISRKTEPNAVKNVLSNGVYEQGVDTDIIKWEATEDIAVYLTYEDNKITIKFGMQSVLPGFMPIDPAQMVVKSISPSTSNLSYTFTLKKSANIEGVYTEYRDGELRLVIKKRKEIAMNDAPLTGFTFVIDAGHGGTDNGAIGPMGSEMSEKTINLNHALKLAGRLEQMGATVIMTRDTDIFLTLAERTEISRNIRPDLFISVHANSVAETTDSVNIKGLTVWHRNEMSLPLAAHLSDFLANVNPDTTRAVVRNESNFFVCRPLWTQSVLIETSFICNVWDFSWLSSDFYQEEFAEKTAAAILSYYRYP